MSPARVAKPSSSTRAPSLASAVVIRATISSSAIGRRVMPRFAASSSASCSISGSGVRLRLPGRVVLVPAGAGLLSVAAHLEQPIGNRRLRPFRARLADRLQVLPDARADVDAGDVLHPERSDRQAEVGQHAIDLLDARAFFEQQVRLAHVVGEHPVGDEAEAVADDDADLAELLRQLERRRDRLPCSSRGRGRSRAASSRWPG